MTAIPNTDRLEDIVMDTTRNTTLIARRGSAVAQMLGVVVVAMVAASCGVSAASPSAATPSGASPSVAATADPATVGGTALGLQEAYVDVVQKVSPSVVLIQTTQGLGSGIIYDADGNIVTNAHVTGGSQTFSVTLPDGQQFDGSLVGMFREDDLAVVHIDAQGLAPATFADSANLTVGDIVLAVGNPLGLQSSVTDGIISAVGRTVRESGSVTLPNTIQTSAPINPGNSGGALVNLAGEVVGIPTLAASDPHMGGAAVGIGFAIPSDTVTDVADQLIRFGRVVDSHRSYLGVTVADITGGSGVLVHSVERGGPAAEAGIDVGDLVVSIDGQATPSSAALADVLANLTPGQQVPVAIVDPDGTRATVDVTLGELPG